MTEIEQLDARKRNLYRYFAAYWAMSDVIDTCDLVLALPTEGKESLVRALIGWIVVSYGRPFTKNEPVGPLADSWSNFDDSELNKNHEAVMALRNKVVAHCDAQHNSVTLFVDKNQNTMRLEFDSEEFDTRRVRIIRRMATNLQSRLNKAILSEQDWLIKNIEIPPEGLNLSGKLPEWKFGKETWVQARVKF